MGGWGGEQQQQQREVTGYCGYTDSGKVRDVISRGRGREEEEEQQQQQQQEVTGAAVVGIEGGKVPDVISSLGV